MRRFTKCSAQASAVSVSADTLCKLDDVREHERMLTDGFYAEVTLSYDAIIAQQQSGRPFAIDATKMSDYDVISASWI